ncbi:MAG: hypothetical protein U0P46_07765 [Holophagaceae bacterium]
MRTHVIPTLARTLLACSLLPLAAQDSEQLDKQYGLLSQPAYIKHYEADKTGKVILNPYLQVASRDYPAVLDVKMAPYNWVIDAAGRVGIIPEAAHPLGRTYEKGFFRPEDQSKRKPGTRENFGHVSALGGAPGRISGEILYDKASNSWTINNKSGRYTKHNTDRTPEQLVNAAKLIRDIVDPGTASWGPVFFLLDYAHESVQEVLLKDPQLAYDDAAKKSRPHIIVLPAAPVEPKVEKPAAKAEEAPAKPAEVAPKKAAEVAPKPEAPKAKKAKKPKAANNDDPS